MSGIMSKLRITPLLISLVIISGLVLTACGDNTPVPVAFTVSPTTLAAVPPTATTSVPTSTPVPPTATSIPATPTALPPTATSVPPTATPIPATLETLKITGAEEVVLDPAVNDLLARVNENSSTKYPNLKGRVFVAALDQQTLSKNALDAIKGLGYSPQNSQYANPEGLYVTSYSKANSPELATVAVPLTADFENALSNSNEPWAKTLAPKAKGKLALLWLYTGGDILKYGYLLTAPKVSDVSNSFPGEDQLPLYPNARRVVPDLQIPNVYYLTSDDYKKVLDFYKTNLPLKGWVFEHPEEAMFDAGGISVNRITKGDTKASITVVNPKAPAEFKIPVNGAGPNDTVIWLILP